MTHEYPSNFGNKLSHFLSFPFDTIWTKRFVLVSLVLRASLTDSLLEYQFLLIEKIITARDMMRLNLNEMRRYHLFNIEEVLILTFIVDDHLLIYLMLSSSLLHLLHEDLHFFILYADWCLTLSFSLLMPISLIHLLILFLVFSLHNFSEIK